MPKRTFSWGPSAQLIWDGELPSQFRSEASDVLKAQLSDEAWDHLCGVVRRYAFALSFEHAAVSPAKQQQGLLSALKACEKLIVALELVEQPNLGMLLNSIVQQKWEDKHGRMREAERNTEALIADLSAALQSRGDDEAVALDAARSLVRGSALAALPSPSEDFLVQLREVRCAISAALDEVKNYKDSYTREVGYSFLRLVGELDELGKTLRNSSWCNEVCGQ